MNLALKDELRTLTQQGSKGPFLSLFMPTHRTGLETQQNPIRFKNLIGEAETELASKGVRRSEAAEFLAQARGILDDSFFWRRQSDGLAMYISPELFRTYSVPLHFDELVMVADRFYLRPLFTLFHGEGRFFVLALSQNEIRLVQCTLFGASEVDLGDVPRSMDEALKNVDFEKHVDFHTRVSDTHGTMFQGHGMGVEDAKDNIQRYFQKVNEGLRKVLKDEHAPLVLAGVDYLLPIYREVNTHLNLFEEAIIGNPEGLKPEELRDHGANLLQPYFRRRLESDSSRFMELVGSGRASSDIVEIIQAVHQGRVEVLFVSVGQTMWGKFHADSNEVDVRVKPEANDEDLLDLAAVQTFLTGGLVHVMEPGKAPGGGPLAAIFRY